MAYKLVLKKDGVLYSLVNNNKNQIVYNIGQWIGGKYPLFIFKDLELAVNFKKHIEHIGNVEIWKCNARKIKEVKLVSKSIQGIDKYWKNGGWKENVFNHSFEYTFAPTGTYVADKVKLKERVESF